MELRNKNFLSIGFIVFIVFVVFFVYSKSNKNEEGAVDTNTVTKTKIDPAIIKIESVTNKNKDGATAVLSDEKTVTWKTSNYPKSAGVNINLLKKISGSPTSFKLIRSISVDGPNDGSESWMPNKNEKTDDVYIEVTCSNTFQFKTGCQLSNGPIKVN